MANDDRARDALELAAASPDPAVRRLAIRYKEIHREIEILDGFFSIYTTVGGNVTAGITGSAAGNGTSSPAQEGKAVRPAVAKALQGILAERGPLDLDSLHAEYVARYPEDAGRTREQVRMGLARHPERFRRVSPEDRRMCLADAAAMPKAGHGRAHVA